MSKREINYNMRLSAVEYELFRRFAAREGSSVSAFIRRHVLTFILKEIKKK